MKVKHSTKHPSIELCHELSPGGFDCWWIRDDGVNQDYFGPVKPTQTDIDNYIKARDIE